MSNTTPTDNLAAAVAEFIARQTRSSHPAGNFDNAGRWYPIAGEHCECCDSIRTPSRAWPNTLNKHCRSAAHVANLYGVDVTELRRAVRAAKEV